MKMIKPGKLVYWRDKSAIVLELNGFSEAIIRLIENSSTEVVRVSDLALSPSTELDLKAPHLLAKGKEWDKAIKRLELIRPIIDKDNRNVYDVEKVAREAGKSVTTIYRWLKRFDETGLASSLLRSPRKDKGDSKLSQEVKDIIKLNIERYYLVKERPTVCKLYRHIELDCYDADLTPPHKNTIYARIKEVDQREFLRKRYSPKHAKEKMEPLRGRFPNQGSPYSIIQIDHTPYDIIVVDSEHRQPIGRPYLTAGIDVDTKMIAGFCLTLDPPSSISAGLCIAHAVSNKEEWLAKRDIDAEWPIYGKMQKIHLDNAKEFRGKMLERACTENNIIREWRPKGQPNYGPHIERVFRTFMGESHSLPGTTFSNVAEKLDYNSEGKACMTLGELEKWFTLFVVYCYHHRPHKGICGIAPIKLYHQRIHGTADYPGIGLPAPIENMRKFELDFTPYFERTVQREGVIIDHIHYYAPILRQWVNARKSGHSGEKRKFIFARDPRDISIIYFLDPDSKMYCPIPYLDNTRPAISIWELRAVTKNLQKDPVYDIDEEMIFKGIRKMREIEAEAIEKTRLAKQQRASEKRKRRMAERRNKWKDIHQEYTAVDNTDCNIAEDEDDFISVPFSDIEIS